MMQESKLIAFLETVYLRKEMVILKKEYVLIYFRIG